MYILGDCFTHPQWKELFNILVHADKIFEGIASIDSLLHLTRIFYEQNFLPAIVSARVSSHTY